MCEHKDFNAKVAVNRLEDSGKFNADVAISCSQCGLPFQFLGLTAGLNLSGAAVSIDGLEARLAICPQGAQQSPIQQMMHGKQSSH